MNLRHKWYKVCMPDGKYFAVPMSTIINNRATYYAHEFNNNVTKSIDEDTLPLFESDHYEITDWAQNNMNWSDVKKYAVEIHADVGTTDYQDGWVNGDYEIIESP